MNATRHTQPTRRAKNRAMTASTVMETLRRRPAWAAGTVLAVALLLGMPSSGWAQRVLVINKVDIKVCENSTASNCSTSGISNTGNYEVNLSTVPTGIVTVALTVESDYLKPPTVNKELLTFRPDNWAKSHTVTVTGVDDKVDNPGGFRLVTIKHKPSGGGFSTSKTVYVAVENDRDDAGITLSDPATVTVTEGGTSTSPQAGPSNTYTVQLASEPTGPVTVTLNVEGKSPDAATVEPASLRFTTDDWDEVQTVTVTGIADRIRNPPLTDGGSDNGRSASIKHTATGGSYDNVSAASKPVKILDVGRSSQDARGVIFDPPSLVIDEGGKGSYTIRLTSSPGTSNAEVTLSIPADRNVIESTSLGQGKLIFTANNWDVPQRIEVTVIDNPGQDDDYPTALIAHRFSNYSMTADSQDDCPANSQCLKVTARDKDKKEILVSDSELTFGENSFRRYSVKLTSEPDNDVEVSLDATDIFPDSYTMHSQVAKAAEVKDGENIIGATNKLTFTRTTWNDAQTVFVHGVDNAAKNLVARSMTISHTASGWVKADVKVKVNDFDNPKILITDFPAASIPDKSNPGYKVGLNTSPVKQVKVKLTMSSTRAADGLGTGDCTSPTKSIELTFAAGPNATAVPTAQDVKICVQDAARNSNRTVTITHTASGSDEYSGVPKETRYLTVTDDEGGTKSLVINKVTSFGDDFTDGEKRGLSSTLEEADGELDTDTDSNGTKDADKYGKPVVYTVELATDDDTNPTVTLRDYTSIIKVTNNKTSALTNPEGITGQPLALAFTNSVRKHTVYVIGVNDNVFGSRSTGIVFEVNDDPALYQDIEKKITVGDHGDGESVGLLITETDTDKVLTSTKINEGDDETEFTYSVRPKTGGNVEVHVISREPSSVFVKELNGSTTHRGVLTFTPDNWSLSQTVKIVSKPDDVDNPGGQRSVVITHTPEGVGYGYSQRKDITVTVVDQAGDAAGIEVVSSFAAVYEGEEETFTVKLKTAPQLGKTVAVRVTSDATSKATVRPSSLTFTHANWDQAQTVYVTGVSGSQEGVDTAVTLTPSSGNYGGRSAKVPFEVLRSTDPGLRVSRPQLEVSEDDTTTYTVELNTDPGQSVTVSILGDSSVITVTPKSLTFTGGDDGTWDNPQTVTVRGVSDAKVNAGGSRSTTIRHSATGGDYEDESAGVRVTVTDVDATVSVSPSSVTVLEAGGRADFTVKPDGQPTETMTVDVESADPTVAKVSPDTLTFTASDYNVAKTVTVTAVNNREDDPGGVRSTSITITPNGGGYDGVQAPSVSVTVTDDEGLAFSKPGVSVREAGGNAIYGVTLRSEPTDTVTVAVASSDPSAATVAPTALTFTTTDWSDWQTVTVTGVPDDVDNSNDKREVTVTHTPSGAGYSTQEPLLVMVIDDDAAPTGITLAVNPSSVMEDDSPTSVTVSATVDGTTRFADPLIVPITVGADSDSATEGTDYATVADFTLTIAARAASGTGTFLLIPVDDTEFEDDKTITVSGTASGVPVSSDTITIQDDDTITVGLNGSATVTEGETADFTVSIVEGAVSTDVVVTYDYDGGTATAGVDYTAPSGSSTILAGSATSTISILTTADEVLDRGETLVVELTGAATPSGMAAEIATPKQFTTTIEDNDEITLSVDSTTAVEGEPMVFTVTLSGTGMASTIAEDVTVRYTTADGTATAGADYTAAKDVAVVVEAGDDAAQFTVSILDDVRAEPDETFTVTLSTDPDQPLPPGVTLDTTPVTATIDDDDRLTVTLAGTETVPEGDVASFMVTLSQPLEEQVTLSYETADGTASAGADYTAAGPDAAATIAVGETAATFMVATMDDNLAEANETFSVRLTAVNRSAALATLKIDPDPLPEATVTIEDDDELTVSVTGPQTVVEGEAAIYTVSLQGGTGSESVEVDYEVGGTATAGKDFTAPSGGLVIPARQEKGTITIRTMADKVVDPNETLVVKLLKDGTTTAAGSVAVGRPSTATTTIVDPVYESINRVNEAVLPEVARAAAASTLDAVGRRMERGATGPAPAAAADLAGLTGFYRALQANERALQDGSYDLARVLSGTSFLVPLSAHEDGADPGIGFAFWGSGDYRNISGGDPDEADVEWSGSAWSARLGADARFVDSLLTGLALSWNASALDYEDDTGGADRSGTHGTSLISVHPYVGWTTPDFGVWATGGLGWGEVTIDDDEAEVDAQSTGLSQWSLGAGASVTVLAIDDLIAGGTTALKLRGEGLLAHATVEAANTVAGLEVDVNQVRAVVEASHAQRLGSATLTPVLELGGRLDGGDGETGAGFEVGGGVSYADAGFTVESRGRVLLFRDNFGEWGLSGLVQYDPGAPAHGLMVSVRPAFGATASGVAGLWEHGTLDLLGTAEQAGGRVEAEIGYGVPVFGAAGVLTPFAGASLTDAGGNSLSLGSRLLVAPLFEVSLEALRSESAAGATPEHGLTLEGAIRW